MICQNCGVEAPTKYVAFYQNIGALVMRFSSHIKGELCKSCVHKHFWEFTMISLVAGWWGTISLLVNPFVILNNLVRYIIALFMPAVPKDARSPELNDSDVRRIEPQTDYIFRRLDRGDEMDEVLKDTASVTGVTPGQIVLYLQALAHAQEARA